MKPKHILSHQNEPVTKDKYFLMQLRWDTLIIQTQPIRDALSKIIIQTQPGWRLLRWRSAG